MDGTVRAWVDGWVVSRGAAPPAGRALGIHDRRGTGRARHPARPRRGERRRRGTDRPEGRRRGDRGRACGSRCSTTRRGSARWLGEGWSVDPEPGYLMSVPLTAAEAPAAPDGYRLRVWTRGGVTRVLRRGARRFLGGPRPDRPDGRDGGRRPDGDLPRAPAPGPRHASSCAPSRGRPSHQGAETGVLAGTPDGRALYEALGWRVEAPLTSAHFTGAEAEPAGVSALPAAWSTATSRPTERPGPGA